MRHQSAIAYSSLNSILLVIVLLGTQLTLKAAELTNSRPNIILVITDDQGYGPIGKHGNTWIQTPHLDSLYDKSTRFTKFLVSPTCSPTRSAIMTGRHSMRNGITHTILERERMTLDATILPQILKETGYTTAIFGKWHLGDEEPYQPHNRGFDEAFIHGAGGIGQAYACSCADVPNNKYQDPVIRHNGTFKQTTGFCTDVFFQSALGWIHDQHQAKKPFFAYIATNAPHSPYIAPEKNKQRFLDMGFSPDNAGFYGMVENIDENMGLLQQKLIDWKMLDNTLLIFMSDNGTAGRKNNKTSDAGSNVIGKTMAGQDILDWNDNMKGLKGTVDEGGVRVPFFIRWDGRVAAGKDISTIAAHIDILPTIAALTGAKIPANQVEGRNLLPLIEGTSTKWEDRFLFTHQGRWATGKEPNDFQWKNFAVRNQQFRMIENVALFDMQVDPAQKVNIINQQPEVVASMRKAYDEWWQKTRPMMVNETAEMSPTKPFHELYNNQKETIGIPLWKPQQN